MSLGNIFNGFVYLLVTFVLFPRAVSAFDLDAHEAISLRSIKPGVTGASTLDSFLRGVFNSQLFPDEFSDGILKSVNGKVVQDWIGFGSRAEDSPLQRVQEHFHDPTKVWTQAGLPSLVGENLWSFGHKTLNQDNGVGGGNHSWKDARDSYRRALMSTNQAERDQAWSETFETLGHLIHLV
jgi:hypothetical protein